MSIATVTSARTGWRLFSLLLLVIAVTRLGSNLYLPALPAMHEDLGIPTDALNSTLTVFFVTFAIATLVAGPLVDTYGRRTVIRLGLLIFVAGSLLGGLAEGMPQLWASRILQAVGVACVPVSARVMVRDAYGDREMLNILGWVGAISSFVPIVAAVLGGFIVEYANWQATFHVLTVAGIATAAATWKTMPETMQESQPLHAGAALRSYGRMLQSGSFSLVVLPLAFCFIIQGAYFATAPYIFVHTFDLKPSTFGLSNIFLVIALVGGRQMTLILLRHLSLFKTYLIAACLAPAGGLLMLGLFLTDTVDPINFLVATSIYCIGFGGLMPIGMKSVLTVWRAEGGKASSLFGCCTFGAMAIGSMAVTALGDHPNEKLPILVGLTLGFGALTAASATLTVKRLA